MIVATSVLDEEVATRANSTYSHVNIKQKPAMLRGPAGNILKDVLSQHSLFPDNDYFYTALCRWLLPKATRLRPSSVEAAWGAAALDHDVKTVKPKVIVTFGKAAFHHFFPHINAPVRDLRGAWFHHAPSGAYVYPLGDITEPVAKPDVVERWYGDFAEVVKQLQRLDGVVLPTVPLNYQTIRDSSELFTFVSKLRAQDRRVLSVDCEWHGRQHIDGQLRSLQICYADGEAAYIRFRDQENKYVFDVDYATAGKILSSWLDRPEVKYVGHHISADLPWMHHVLGLQYWQKTVFDTEFAQQLVDDASGLGLEVISCSYTDRGRYDMELYLWKRDHKDLVAEGYGFVPDDILIPYACADVDVVFRAVPQLALRLVKDRVMGYYNSTLLPFVSDVFTDMCLLGLPVNIPQLDMLRRIYWFASRQLLIRFQQTLTKSATVALGKMVGNDVLSQVEDIVAGGGDHAEALNICKRTVGAARVAELLPVFDHFVNAPAFKIRSAEQMRQWLFKIKGYTPIKSTKNEDMPSISWEKVLTFPEERQRLFSPAVDKQTLMILGEQHNDDEIRELLRLNAVGNICKAFLKEAEVDELTGEVVKENGLHYWIASDGRIHGQMSTTETGRPRSWNPNVYNLPSWVNEFISDGILKLFQDLAAEGQLPDEFKRFLDEGIPSIRSVIAAPEGQVMVESDYKTAEIRGLAFISGDENLIRLMTEPDQQFALVKKLPGDKEHAVVRLYFAADCGIPKARQRRDVLMAVWSKGKRIRSVTMDDLLLDEDGKVVHPPHDLHWSLAELVKKRPREVLSAKKDRAGIGKVGNFSTSYGATGATLDRKIEADTGAKPEPGTGDQILEALQIRQPIAFTFLEDLAKAAESPGYWRAESGRLRRARVHDAYTYGLSERQRSSALASVGREFRNFPFQESVASTSARAAWKLLDTYRRNGWSARIVAVLYDSVVTLCDMHERHMVREQHQLQMTDNIQWHNHGRTWNYPTEHEFNLAWSARPLDESSLN